MAGGAETPYIAALPAIARLAAQTRFVQRRPGIHAIPDACYAIGFGRKLRCRFPGFSATTAHTNGDRRLIEIRTTDISKLPFFISLRSSWIGQDNTRKQLEQDCDAVRFSPDEWLLYRLAIDFCDEAGKGGQLLRRTTSTGLFEQD